MPDWNSSTEIQRDEIQRDHVAFVYLIHSLLGVYAWECLLSLDFDFAFLTGRKPFRWPMIFYFANRYLLLCVLIGALVASDSRSKINCQPLFVFIKLAGTASTTAGVNLCLRTIAIYGHSKPITIFLVILILGHWTLTLMNVQIKAVWNDKHDLCVVTAVKTDGLVASYIYSTCFNLIVFLLNAYKLYGHGGKQIRIVKSQLEKLIFSDGLAYFFVAFLANLTATFFLLLSPNPHMGNIFDIPAVVISTICATRAIRRLSNFKFDGDQAWYGSDSSSESSDLQFRSTQGEPSVSDSSGSITVMSPDPGGVHVQVEIFTRAEDGHLQRREKEREVESGVKPKASPI
ncbi:hypothetical protein E1B28_009193 [Marasmius oreades]|uniref:Transmembrane protein n=1 Tax=Marasmius oreades TaxID=181124 RepID=A0A9P7USX1_9AGAR|nr:uncharacterized protein E1B28_009193 [Marasmius oreades]KAG7092883.1 hypothetical protein E1B28_009193 [Marasmius oreades]